MHIDPCEAAVDAAWLQGKPHHPPNKHITHVGGCQDYGPFLDPYYTTAPNI